jgi:hypothetical protein
MTSNTGLSPKGPNNYVGPNVYLATVVTRNRAPTGADYRQPETGKLYPLDTYWIVGKDPTTGTFGDLWYLATIIANVASWKMLSSGSSGPTIGFVVPNGSSPVFPTAGGLVTYTSTGGTITITGSTNTINFDLSGGSVAADSFQVDAVTAPGVQPVVPTAAGLVTMTGAQVAPGTVGANVIRSVSLAANTITYQIQQTSVAASLNTTLNGVAHFNSAQFTNSQGFISLINSNLSVVIQTFTATGAYTPTAGMVYCIVQMLGGGGAGGGGPATSAIQCAAGGGGASGEYAVGVFSAATIGASKAVTIGAGAVGNTTTGSAGGTTSLGVLMTAIGGGGGTAGLADTTCIAIDGGDGGTGGTGGSYRCPGQPGLLGVVTLITPGYIAVGGIGGNSQLGSGGTPAVGAGGAGSGYGAGGAGCSNIPSTGAPTNGGNGTAGIVVVTEYVRS